MFLTHSFLQKHLILLEEGCLTVNWDQIPGLYRQTDKLLMVSVTDKQWEKWGRSGGWTAWEPDTQSQHFFRNLAMVVCKGAFYNAKDPKMQTKVGHFISIGLCTVVAFRAAPGSVQQLYRCCHGHRTCLVAPGQYTILGCLFPVLRGTLHHYGSARPNYTVWYGR